jgi:cobalt-zinc-cadmium efflux system protein
MTIPPHSERDFHGHGHDDRHPGHGRVRSPAAGLGWALVIVLGFGLLEVVVGWLSGSLALASDGLHMLTDAGALALAWGAQWMARRPADSRLTFGYERVEALAGFVNALVYLALLAWIVIEAIGRLAAPPPIDTDLALPVAVLGLVINIAVWWVLQREHGDLNVRGALLHVVGDLVGSVVAISAILSARYLGTTVVDPLMSLVLSGLLLISTSRLLRDASRVLMNATPPGLYPADIASVLSNLEGVRAVHDLHVWLMSSGQPALAAHVSITELSAWPGILEHARHELDQAFGIRHVTLQPELEQTSSGGRATV